MSSNKNHTEKATAEKQSEYPEEHQEITVHGKCPTDGCPGHTFVSIPEQVSDNLECTLCGQTTPAKDWLS